MPLRLPLAIGRGRLQFRLGLRQFCRHACTSLHIDIGCIALLGSNAFSPHAEMGAELSICLPPVLLWTGNTCGRWSSHDEHVSQTVPEHGSACNPPTFPKRVAALPPSIQEPHRSSPAGLNLRIYAVRQALSSGDALPMGAFAACSMIRNERCGESSLLSGELLYPFRVARVSRLIGKSDSTAKRPGWQVNFGLNEGY